MNLKEREENKWRTPTENAIRTIMGIQTEEDELLVAVRRNGLSIRKLIKAMDDGKLECYKGE